MGKNTDKLYVTHSEHTGVYGGHHTASSSGYVQKPDAGPPQARQPFDCCALSFQPFEHPVCARNNDGTGIVFDLVNIIPWLKQHNNTNPVTKEPLKPESLIKLNYSRKATGEYHDPISFKPFSEHSHIVAITTTGNVYLAESIKGGRDLLDDVKFKKEDVITLQNPHGMPPVSGPSISAGTTTQQASDKQVTKPKPLPANTIKEKAAVPWNISPYSNGLPGASLTSTSVDPTANTSTKLLWDEEELMFEEFSNPPKGKGKEKDVGKRRAYCRVITSLGGGLNIELFCEKAPKTCYNFLMLAKAGKYKDVPFHRLVPGFMIQTGDPTGTGAGGESYWGTPFRDEHDLKGAAKHDKRGVISMANKGANTNGSQWFITFKPTPHLDKKHTVFGNLVGGDEVLDTLEKLPVKAGTERPAKPVRITDVIIYQDPFEEYKRRQEKRRARKAQAEEESKTGIKAPKKDTDDTNWFGTRLGSGPDLDSGTGGVGSAGGVGRYLNLKRPLDGGPNPIGNVPGEEGGKKRKLGFGDFEGW